MDDFLRELRARFKDSSRAQEAEAEIKLIRQKGWPVKEVVQEFCRQAARLRNCPECILVHYFKECIYEELLKMCLCWGVSDDRVFKWYKVATVMDNELRQHRRTMLEKQPQRQLGHRPALR